MTISVCVSGLIADGRITKGQGEEIERYYTAHFNRLKGQMDMMAAADLASERAIRQMQYAIDRRKLLAARAIETQTRLNEQLHAYNGGKMSDGKGGGPIDPRALPALLGGNDPRHLGGTLEGKHMAVQAQIDSMMRQVLLKHGPDVFGRITDKAGLDDLGREAFGQDTGNHAARDLAKAWETAREWTRGRANAAGADIGKLEDYGLQMHWDSDKVRALPDYAAFRDVVLPELDRTRMIDHETGVPFDDAKLDEVMHKVWQGIRSDGWDDREPGGVGRASMANDGQDPRFFVFKDYDSWNRANDRLGNGNAFTSMNGMLEHRARQIAALETLGPNPDHTMQWLQDVVTKSAKTDEAPNTRAPEAAAHQNRIANNMWQEFKGTLNRPEDKKIAAFFGTMRNLKSAAALGSAFISQQSDLGLNWSARAFNGLPEIKVLGQWLDMLKPSLKEDREFAARQLMGLEEQRHYTAVQNLLFGREFAKPWSTRMVSTVMNLQGSSRWAQLGRHNFGRDWWGAITSERAKAWDALDPTFRGAMQRGGFDAAAWDQLRATPTEDVRGVPWIVADNIQDENLRLKAAEMILRQAHTVVPIPDLRARAAMNSVVKRGTYLGEMLRSPMMFKGFGVSIAMAQLQRIMTMPAQSAARYAARFAIGMTVLGALETQLRHITKGQDPEDMTKPGFWGNAMLAGGTGGIFADYLKEAMQDPDKGILSIFAGPMAEDLQNLAHVVVNKGPDGGMALNRNPAGSAYKFARTALPGGSIWYARLAFDRMIGDEVQQAVDPNYRHSWSTVQQYARERGSPMFAPPGEPMRAPDFGRATGQPSQP
ncbi:hypothetical protein [Novosphingobium sp. FSW06-99]|uniref:hypothetical protein n=1 Tax=Novosphingobium sp. FSW06-99 TaxID=1739113 RepID=UPI00076D74A7|nr:hypothetical protein [Novosphingobium sp. FSW06-99]KUR80904.1 hypothetical protein AQZ49_02455 [Novosphingobium sp. FSW06-99]